MIGVILAAARGALGKAGITPPQLVAAGVGAAGTSNPRNGVISYSPNLPGWGDVPLGDIMERELGVKTLISNDASAAAFGELCFGAGRGFSNIVYVTLGTGIGGGIIIDGRLYTGTSGAAGEVGHMIIDDKGPRCSCGNLGCWEALASGTALAREARQKIEEGAKTSLLDHARGSIGRVTAETVHRAAREGDTLAGELIARAGYYLGVGCANLINIFNPELVIIGGGLANLGNRLLEPAIKAAEERALAAPGKAVRFAIARLGRDSGVLGAAALAFQGMKD